MSQRRRGQAPTADSYAELLSRVPFFSEFSETDLNTVAQHAALKHYSKGSIIISEGDGTDSLFVTVSGRVKAFLMNHEGKELILSLSGPGEYFGEIALLDEAPRSASVMALEPCTAVVVTRADFIRCLGDHPEIAVRVIGELTGLVRSLTENVRSLALEDVYGRLVSTLMHLAIPQDGAWVVMERLTHQDLASMVGASREMISKILKDLVTGGYLSNEHQRIRILRKLPPSW